MPVFHTKTIKSILEPVAQQVSKLVILHEEAEEGNAMPDLSRPVQVVKMAVDNLIKVGYETTNNSNDHQLKEDMPVALRRVEDSCGALLDASTMIRDDPYSSDARARLIEGSRGILQGTSGLLLAFDESEVRKITRICQHVLEYLAITEVIDNLEDLVTFVKNLSPVLTRMTKEVDTREKELTHQVHREWLQRSLEQVKQLTPSLITSIKIFVTNKHQQGGSSLEDALSSRNYVTDKLTNEVHEIIRVLQLQTYDEVVWEGDDITVVKKAQNAIDNKMKPAHDWLSDPTSTVGTSGENTVRGMLQDALQIAQRCADEEDEEVMEGVEGINKTVSNVTSMLNALCELKQNGDGNSSQAISLSKGIEECLKELQGRCRNVLGATDKFKTKQPAHTLTGKLEQAQQWLSNRNRNDARLGYQAVKRITEDGLNMASNMPPGLARKELTGLCQEVDVLANQLEKMSAHAQGNSPQGKQTAIMLSQKLNQLRQKLQEGIIDKVAEDFLDISTHLKSVSDAAMLPLDTVGREETFEDKASTFTHHTGRLVETGRELARVGVCSNRRVVEGLLGEAQMIEDLLPQLVKAARLVLHNPNNQASLEHYDLLKRHASDSLDRLRCLADEAIDADSFIRHNEEGMLRDTDRAEQCIRQQDPAGFVNNTSRVARRAHRVLQVAQSEADNSDDPRFVEAITLSTAVLRNNIAPMIQEAKCAAQNPHNPAVTNQWRSANNKLIVGVSDVRGAVGERGGDGGYPGYPEMSQLHISSYSDDNPPPRPPLPLDVPPPRPPPPETDDEFEVSFPSPQTNQPIMMAAHALHNDAKQWSSRDNDLIVAAKKMALLMARLSQLVRGLGGSKKDLIDCSRVVAEASEEVTALAKKLAHECTDKRMRMNLLQVCERIPTIGTQLKILSTVKATMLGAQESSCEEDDEATEMLIGNAQNLMQSVRETLVCAEAASIKIRVDSGYSIRWLRKRPWYA